MQITIRYFDGCPNWRLAEQRLHEALNELGISDADVAVEPVETHEEALRVGFRGSPTVLVDGRDPFGDAHADIGLACRVYATPIGPQGAPTVEQLRAALAG